MHPHRIVHLVLILASLVPTARAGIINDGPMAGTYTIGSFPPIGQTFRSVDSAISLIGFEMSIANFNQPAPPAITFNLYSGEGVDGVLVASRTIAGPGDAFPMPPRFLMADFTGTALSVGAMYTITLVEPTEYWGVSHTFDLYPERNAVLCGSLITSCNFSPHEPSDVDLKFKVLSSVPEPGTFGLVAVFIACALCGRRLSRLLT